ncbi:MAG TPA: aminopeptidase P N-terminal domain-containing protein [Rhodocyclaceae bacterium]|nr:aminopeptidase P N-terminal domain-containing protein [Rhodocyclaceae bacterium]
MNTQAFKARRLDTLKRMGAGIAIVPTAPEQTRNRDTHFPFRADSYAYYLSGFVEPEAVVVLIAGEKPQSILFCRDKNEEREIWDGFRWGPAAAAEAFGFDAAYSVNDLDAKLVELMANQPSLYYAVGHDATWDTRITQALNGVRAQARAGKRAPENIRDIRSLLDAQRLIKDELEIATMREAGVISGEAHRRAMRATRPGRFEYEIEAELIHEFRTRGCQSVAYPSIVAGGKNACVLHYVENNQQLNDGDLLLIDAGGELDGYASDITRTFPVNGRFSGAQRDVYQLVLNAQDAAIAATKPGNTFHDPHDAAVRVLAQGMLDLGLLQGSFDSVMEQESYKRFYMHRTGHWLGLDVHDAGEYKDGEDWKKLQPGMMLTIEPGCYIRPADDVPAVFHNIGIRIEDDALVTAGGCDIITKATPKTIAEIEAVMAETR